MKKNSPQLPVEVLEKAQREGFVLLLLAVKSRARLDGPQAVKQFRKRWGLVLEGLQVFVEQARPVSGFGQYQGGRVSSRDVGFSKDENLARNGFLTAFHGSPHTARKRATSAVT